MVRITKTMQVKHSDSLSPWIKEFRDSACSVALPLLPQHLATFPTKCPFPRGDLYHWIPLLNRFDDVLEKFCKVYKLDQGPQVVEFGCVILEPTSTQSVQASTNGHDIERLGYSEDGDRQLVESILDFSRMLLQNCGNRSIYASSAHLNCILNTTSLSLLQSALSLGSELSQRYQAALKRMNIPVRHVSNAMLASHYNVDLERVLQLAMPFSKTVTTTTEPPQPTTPATPTVKGKEKSFFNNPAVSSKTTTTTIHANDLVGMVKGGSGVASSPKGGRKSSDIGTSSSPESYWADWGEVKVTYYPKASAEMETSNGTPRPPVSPSASTLPVTPTPIRRSSNLGPYGQRPSRQPNSEESPVISRPSVLPSEDTPSPSYKTVEISATELRSSDIHALLRDNVPKLPQDRQFELLTKLRVAKALTTSVETRQQILAVRLLAITNLAYIHSESTFQDEVLKQDGDESRRLQLVYQLAELVHPPAEGVTAVPRPLQTLAFAALDALSGHQVKFQDICSALNTTVNHGVLLYVVRKAVAEMDQEDSSDKSTADDDWRDALFSLLANLSLNPRTGGELVTAGLIPILVEVLSLHTSTAERYHRSILQFLDTILFSARDAFSTLVSANGLDVVSDLIVFEVKTAAENASSGKGMLSAYRSASVDYDIPYFQQQTLKWLFKFIHHMMSTAGGNGGNFDRLLRNLIDSSQLLSSLRQIIENSRCFGSIVWTNAVSILNDFINNEPTSYAVIAEAGLSRGLLEAVTGTTIKMPPESKKSETESPASPIEEADTMAETSSPSPPSDDDESEDESYEIQALSLAALQAPREGPLARGIMPTSETINIVPQAFGAICLNTAGMKMFQASKALESFFEIFESPEHVKCMDANKDLPSSLGSTFDELVRHHPPLKGAIMNSILNMVARVNYLCKTKGEKNKIGAQLWTTDVNGKTIAADEEIKNSLVDRSVKGKGKAVETGSDTDMMDVELAPSETSGTQSMSSPVAINGSMTPYVAAVGTFLSAMFSNSSARSDFSLKGGIEYVLDLASSPCLPYDFGDGAARRTIHQVIALLAESKPHLALPSLLKRAQHAANDLRAFANHTEAGCFFEPFVNPEAQRLADVDLIAQGTNFAKALVNIHSLVATINMCFQTAQIYAHRSNSSNFTQINVADYYIALVKSLGPLLGSSLREDMQLQHIVPSHWKTATRVKDSGLGDTVVDSVLGVEPVLPAVEEPESVLQSQTPTTCSAANGDVSTGTAADSSAGTDSKPKTMTKVELDSACFKNYQTLRYLISKMWRTISPFFQTLGKALVPKRSVDPFQKSTHVAIADSLAETILGQLSLGGHGSSVENYSYWISLLQVLTDMLIEGASRATERPVQTITLVLQAFKERDGINTLNDMLRTFTSEIRSTTLPVSESPDKSKDDPIRFELATAGTKSILALYAQFVNGKNVTEASQTMTTIGGRPDRDRARSEQLSTPQFLVELRMAVLPTVRELWESDIVDKGPSQISEKLIDVIRTICNADYEAGASKRADKVVTPAKPSLKVFKPTLEYQTTLHGNGYDAELTNEALYRCNNSVAFATDYCREMARPGAQRNPIPAGDLVSSPEAAASLSRPQTSTSTGTATPDDHIMQESALSGIIEGLSDLPAPPSEVSGPPDLARLFAEFESRNQSTPDRTSNTPTEDQSTAPRVVAVSDETCHKQVTIEDLNEERDVIRDNLIDKCLDVINAHGEVTFEISDLITTVVGKSPDPSTMRGSVSETLVVALMSFAGEDDLRTCGKKIAAYAHLLALMLRDKAFYAAALPNLKENLSTLLSFVKLSPNHSAEEPSPWIAHILLIVEMLLSEDAKPVKTKWTPPKDDNEIVALLVFEATELSVPEEERSQLLEAILDILPRIGKDESLALAVLRILVVLTRARTVAQIVGEKKNIQRLFVMAKQLAGASSARIQSPLMLILRHIIEDDETVKQIMRTDIKSFFENNRQSRSIDEKHFLRGMAHTALRNPQLFVGVASEMVKLSRWHYPSADSQPRSGILVLKETAPQIKVTASKISEDSVQPAVQGTEDLSIQDVKPSTEVVDSEMPDAPRSALPEQKLPIVENPDGVIHFLLCELLNYRDVEDKDPVNVTASATDKTTSNTNGDVPMTGTTLTPDGAAPKTSKPPSKPEFKAEDHPIYIYRCFILQCLTELLSSYNRTKIEFINFKRSAPPQAMTPSKPRSSVVNYLLFDLIPVGTLDHGESTALRKKLVTSSWADSVLTALLSKTGEQFVDKEREAYGSENEPDLLFVRRFVLENILKAYKEATFSNEPLDSKYSRLLALAELMSHIMNGKENVGMPDTLTANTSQKQLRRIMFEKGFVSALTSSIADIDLDFPNAKRAVKYILRPLRTLTTTAVSLSDLALISTSPGQIDDDEIESATSISDPEEEREETPDLFRNSTLGMFEPGREEDTSSESDDDEDEEMYEGEYGEEMEYGEDEQEDDEDNISDEDEEIEGMGPIEGLSGDHAVDVEVIMGDDDDDDDDDDDEDSSGDDDEEHDSEDDDARVEIIDEAGNIQQLDEEDMMGEWESDDEGVEGEEGDYEGQAADQEEEQIHAMEAMGGPLGHLVRALGGDDATADMIEQMEAEGLGDGGDEDDDGERIVGEFAEEVDEDDDEDDDDEEMDEDEMLFEQYPLDGPGAVSFGWQDEVEPPVIVSRRSRGGQFSPFPFIPGGRHDPLGGTLSSLTSAQARMRALVDFMENDLMAVAPSGNRNRTNPLAVPEYRSSYRSHRSGAPAQRLVDDGTNPLLQRNGPGGAGREGIARIPSMGSWIRAMGNPGAEIFDIGLGGGGGPFGEGLSLQNRLLRSLPPLPGHIARNGQALQFHITTGPGHQMPPDLQELFTMGRPSRFEPRRDAAEPGSAAFFTPQSTSARWLEEAKIIFGATLLERANDMVNSLSALLIPPAVEAERVIKAAEAERVQKAQEEAKQKAEEERIAKEAREAEEKIAQEKKEAEEREAAERAAAEALAARGPETDEVQDEGADPTESAPDAMEGVEAGTPVPSEQVEDAPAADRPRITTMIRGSPYDITDLGIDPSFLEELPEEIREEVIMSAVADRRSRAAATGTQPSEIDQEFLAALPDDIRDEIILQERQDRRRREREERNRQAAAANGGAVAGEMNAAEILATLPPQLRNQVLMEQDEETLNLLPPEIADQARAALRDHPVHGRAPSGFPRRAVPPGEPRDANTQRIQKHPTVQMLDKSGVATLLRLMFIFQHGSLRSTLNSVLQNICLNRYSRTEVLTTLLHILQDGSIDMSAIDRSFAHLSLKAKQPKDTQPKTPQPLKRVLTGTTPAISGTLEASPLLLVQQCLSALVYLTQANPHTPAFFLTEHDNAGASKRSVNRKSKGKESKAGKYALNSLLSLLDRDLIMESSTVMEALSTLLNMITAPLQALQRKQKEAEVADKTEITQHEASSSVAENTASIASPEASSTHNEQTADAPSETSPDAESSTVETTSAQGIPINGAEQASAVETQASKSTVVGKETEKKARTITPPVIPEHNLQLVINIFVARECSSKTFRETLSTIKNLSAIPGAKVVFGRELISKAQSLGEVILVDLDELLPQIQKASTGTEIQGVALAKFSPGSSDQNKLLRVLTALDHLFDPKREKTDKPNEFEGESSQLMEKQDLLSSLYDNPTFGRMWERLSKCLAVIRQREHMLNVATILLPLIEALMVVCKNTTLKDAPLARSQGKDMILTSPPPESRMESLFFTFTEEHRKILNDLVRHTPKLMSGTFSLLVKNPKVLEFDNKRNYFSRSIHSKAPNSRQSFPPLQLSVRRDLVFHDSFRSLYFQTGDQMKYGKLSIRFHGEEGVDAGGVTREWFQVLARQMFDPGYALFIPVSSDRTTFHPNQLSSINEEHLMFFKFIGRIIGKALYENRVLDCHFSRAVYKRILGKAVSVKDMESLDPDYYKSLIWMLENDITDIITETFSVDNDKFGVVETIDFIPNGRTVAVTEENKHEYVRLMVEWKLTGSVKAQLDEFLRGFHEIISADLVAIFNEQELELLISGLPEIDVDDWKGHTEYHNYSASSPQIQWFWRAVRSYDKEERAKLLQFVTGTSKVPLNGFKELEGMNGFSRFNIHRDYGNKDRLPSSHTCFNQLDLPEYESYEALRQQVLTAITAGSEYFGFA